MRRRKNKDNSTHFYKRDAIVVKNKIDSVKNYSKQIALFEHII